MLAVIPRESAVQYSLTRNRLFCTHLNYPSISSHLLVNAVLTREQDAEIRLRGDAVAETTAGRMQELITFLLQLDSVPVFLGFQQAVIHCGELELGKRLLHDYMLMSERLKLMMENTPEGLLDPVVLKTVFDHVQEPDLITARQVCSVWNESITAHMAPRLKIRFLNHSQMIDFIHSSAESVFCRNITNFNFSIENPDFAGGSVFYYTFFREFGLRIVRLELPEILHLDLLRFVFSREIQPQLRNVTKLTMHTFLPESLVPDDETYPFLANLESLHLIEPNDYYGYGNMMHFLKAFLKNDHHLRIFSLELTKPKLTWIAVQGFPLVTLRDIFKNHTIESFALTGEVTVDLDNECLELLTAADGHASILKSFIAPLHDKENENDELAVRPETFNNFVNSHQETLKNLEILSCDGKTIFPLMRGSPVLVNLNSLKLIGWTSDWVWGSWNWGDWNWNLGWENFANLSFVRNLPNLKYLEMTGLRRMTPAHKNSPTFQHLGLKELVIGFTSIGLGKGHWILALLPYISDSFPHLNSFEMHAQFDSVDWAWPSKLGSLDVMNQLTGSKQGANWTRTEGLPQ